MTNIEVRTATPEDVATIKGQLAECIAIHVAVLSGEYGEAEALAQRLDERSVYLEQVLNKALAGEPIVFHYGKVSFQAELSEQG